MCCNGDNSGRPGKPVVVDKKGAIMTRYLLRVSYTTEGVRGLLKEGGSSRRAMVQDMIRDLGGSLEAFYYAFGPDDVYAIAELPDGVTAAAVSLTITAAGAAHSSVVVLLTPEEVDAATKKTVAYRAPGT
jgi:uncharacterized protein with GYD domain